MRVRVCVLRLCVCVCVCMCVCVCLCVCGVHVASRCEFLVHRTCLKKESKTPKLYVKSSESTKHIGETKTARDAHKVVACDSNPKSPPCPG